MSSVLSSGLGRLRRLERGRRRRAAGSCGPAQWKSLVTAAGSAVTPTADRRMAEVRPSIRFEALWRLWLTVVVVRAGP